MPIAAVAGIVITTVGVQPVELFPLPVEVKAGLGLLSACLAEQRRLALGADGELGIAEYVISRDEDPPQIVITHVLIF